MTPKEKAFHLHFSFIRDVIADNDKAKICALRVVNEILKEYNQYLQSAVTKKYAIEYWEEVKHEIEQL